MAIGVEIVESKAQLLKEMAQARDSLWRELASIADSTEISPGMTKREIFAHIAGWESLVFEGFREHIYAIPAARYPYPGVDALNFDFLTQRQGMTIENVKLECEINRFAINMLLNVIPEEEFENSVRFRWGDESASYFIRSATGHEREHADDIVKVKHEGTSQGKQP
jgi:hypothetical protein